MRTRSQTASETARAALQRELFNDIMGERAQEWRIDAHTEAAVLRAQAIGVAPEAPEVPPGLRPPGETRPTDDEDEPTGEVRLPSSGLTTHRNPPRRARPPRATSPTLSWSDCWSTPSFSLVSLKP